MTVINNGVVPESCVLTIGKFEGIHRGHQILLTEVIHQAGLMGLASVAMVFDPHPYIHLSDPAYKPLFSNKERNHLIENEPLFYNVYDLITPLELDYLYYYPFDKNFAILPPEDFCKFLFLDCKAKLVIVGENFCFGKNRLGDTTTLQNEAKLYGAEVQILPTQMTQNLYSDIISTSNIRTLVAKGELKKAQQLLGFPFFAMGIIKSESEALDIHLPDNKLLPPDGVYTSNTIIAYAIHRSTTSIGAKIETRIHDFKIKGMCGELAKIELLDFA